MFEHDTADVCRFRVGQNLYISGARGETPADWSRPVESWYSEVESYNGNPARFGGGGGACLGSGVGEGKMLSPFRKALTTGS